MDYDDPRWDANRGAAITRARLASEAGRVLLSGIPAGCLSVQVGVGRDTGGVVVNSPSYTFKAHGSRNGVPYYREFQIGLGGLVEIDATGMGPPFTKGSLTIELISGPRPENAAGDLVAGLQTYAAPVAQGVDPRGRVLVPLLKTYSAAGTYSVPEGAEDFVPLDTDPSFSWILTNPANAAVSIPTGLAANTRNGAPLGSFFSTTSTSLRILWLIAL